MVEDLGCRSVVFVLFIEPPEQVQDGTTVILGGEGRGREGGKGRKGEREGGREGGRKGGREGGRKEEREGRRMWLKLQSKVPTRYG